MLVLSKFPFLILFVIIPTSTSWSPSLIAVNTARPTATTTTTTTTKDRKLLVVSKSIGQRSSTSMSMVSTNTDTDTDTTNNKEIDIKPDQEQEQILCNAAEKFINTQSGYYSAQNSSILSDDFVFRGPIIGPLNKEDYIEVLDYFQVFQAFPDIKSNAYGFTIDPFNTLKVRFFLKATGTYQYPLGGALGQFASSVTGPPDSRPYIGSTEAWAITFNSIEQMQVKCITAGYVIDNFEQDDDSNSRSTTNGKGLTFGILNTLGIPFPTTPGNIAIKGIQQITGKFSTGSAALFPKSSSDPEKIPQWWKDQRRGAE